MPLRHLALPPHGLVTWPGQGRRVRTGPSGCPESRTAPLRACCSPSLCPSHPGETWGLQWGRRSPRPPLPLPAGLRCSVSAADGRCLRPDSRGFSCCPLGRGEGGPVPAVCLLVGGLWDGARGQEGHVTKREPEGGSLPPVARSRFGSTFLRSHAATPPGVRAVARFVLRKSI